MLSFYATVAALGVSNESLKLYIGDRVETYVTPCPVNAGLETVYSVPP